jgi:phosphoribosylanthranilate isomerase
MIRIKICGIVRNEDAQAAERFGADAMGFVFYDQSPRSIGPAQARGVRHGLHPWITPVGLFVDAPVDHVVEVARQVGLSVVQLHGDLSLEQAQELDRQGLAVVKAWQIATPEDVETLKEYDRQAGGFISAYLLDSRVAGVRGGSGQAFDWGLVRDLGLSRPVILAGGLTPDNVVEAIQAVHPTGVDTSSGVERLAGVKDAGKIEAFIRKARQALET